MMKPTTCSGGTRFLVAALAVLASVSAVADTAKQIDAKVDAGLARLLSESPAAKKLSQVAKGVLVFPEVLKAGLLVGGQYGEGALRVDGRGAGYYSTVAESYGLQAGAQTFGYAMFLMTDEALNYLGKSEGWEVGVGPSVVVMDEGTARSMTTTTAKEDIYVFFFNQKGLMAGLGVQGSKISKFTPKK
jgi:lipid-binding SYLF domain-containing protein